MILNFSTIAQQGFAANDKGQMVISYFDSRIRNAGLGLWRCPRSEDIRVALNNIPALKNDDASNRKNLCLPVAVVNNSGDITKSGIVSYDKKTGVYSGNVLTLLYAHKDTHDGVRLILITDKQQNPVTLKEEPTPGSNDFFLIDNNNNGIASYNNSQLGKSESGSTTNTNIKRYAVMESAGVPVYTMPSLKGGKPAVQLQAYTGENQPTIYPMTELLNLECQKLYTAKDENGYNFKFMELKENGTWGNSYYHTKDILDLYMTLDTSPNTADKIPIFELRVLVSEGLNELGTTDKPKDWPGRWKGTDFNTHKVHVSKATWKLYNLAPFFTN